MAGPKWQINNDNIQVIGCKYNASNTLFQQAYYLLDGRQRFPIQEGGEESEIGSENMYIKDKDGFFHLPALTIRSFEQLGRYECVIENKLIIGEKIVTNAVDLTTLKGEE